MAKAFKSCKRNACFEIGDEIVLFSSETGLGKEEAWKAIHKFTKQKRVTNVARFFLLNF